MPKDQPFKIPPYVPGEEDLFEALFPPREYERLSQTEWFKEKYEMFISLPAEGYPYSYYDIIRPDVPVTQTPYPGTGMGELLHWRKSDQNHNVWFQIMSYFDDGTLTCRIYTKAYRWYNISSQFVEEMESDLDKGYNQGKVLKKLEKYYGSGKYVGRYKQEKWEK